MNRIDEIKNHISSFCAQKLNQEYEKYCHNLCDALARKRKLNILKGASNLWAAAIVYTIARINFLFDRNAEHFLTADEICDFFQTKKSTTSTKARQIEKVCKLYYGAEGYSRKELQDKFTYYVTDTGFIIPKEMIDEREMDIEIVFDEDDVDLTHWLEECHRIEKQKRLQELAAKRKKKTDQLGLFEEKDEG